MCGEDGDENIQYCFCTHTLITAGADYTGIFHNLNFTRSTASSPLCVRVTITNDSIVEANETFSVSLHTSDDAVTLLPRTTLVTIMDDDRMCVYVTRWIMYCHVIFSQAVFVVHFGPFLFRVSLYFSLELFLSCRPNKYYFSLEEHSLSLPYTQTNTYSFYLEKHFHYFSRTQ